MYEEYTKRGYYNHKLSIDNCLEKNVQTKLLMIDTSQENVAKVASRVVKEESVEGKYTEIKWRRWLSEALTHSALNNTGDKENIIAMPEGCIM